MLSGYPASSFCFIFSPPVRREWLDFMWALSSSSSSPSSPRRPPPRQCSVSDLNRDRVSSVFRAGPRPRSCEFSVPRRTPTAMLWVQCSAPDLDREMCQKEEYHKICQKICQKECQKICQKDGETECQEECQKVCQKECPKICQKKMLEKMPDRTSETMSQDMLKKMSEIISKNMSDKNCRNNVERYVKKNVRKNAERYVRKKVRKYVRKNVSWYIYIFRNKCQIFLRRLKNRLKPGRRVAGPFWAQAVNQKRQYLHIRIYKSLHCRQCRSCRKSRKVPTMLFCPVRIPSNARVVCSDRRLWPFDPKCALADLAVELWWPDSTPTCDVPSGVRAIAPHSKTGSNVAYTRFLTMVVSQLRMPNLEPEYSTGEECRAIPTTHLCLKAVPR